LDSPATYHQEYGTGWYGTPPKTLYRKVSDMAPPLGLTTRRDHPKRHMSAALRVPGRWPGLRNDGPSILGSSAWKRGTYHLLYSPAAIYGFASGCGDCFGFRVQSQCGSSRPSHHNMVPVRLPTATRFRPQPNGCPTTGRATLGNPRPPSPEPQRGSVHLPTATRFHPQPNGCPATRWEDSSETGSS